MDNIDFSKINIPKIEIPKIDMSNTMTNIDFSSRVFKEMEEDVARHNREKNRREVENNESLKSIVEYNEEIVKRNKELVSLNERILKKINSLDDTLLFLNESFNEKRKEDKDSNNMINAQLLDLITIIDSGDKNKVSEFLSGLGGNIAAGLIVAYFQMKLGLS